MNPTQLLVQNQIQSNQISRCKVVTVREDGLVIVECEYESAIEVPCDVIQTGESVGLKLEPGDTVLVWLPESDEERGIVLGRIGPSHTSVVEQEKKQETPDELVIEAKKNLTLKCGEGSITLRKDGKILIKGKDLVSQAKRTNRVKGGSVTIN